MVFFPFVFFRFLIFRWSVHGTGDTTVMTAAAKGKKKKKEEAEAVSVGETAREKQVVWLQFVGKQQALRRFGRLHHLTHVSLTKARVHGFRPSLQARKRGDQDLELRSHLPKLRSLDLSGNLIGCWGELYRILRSGPETLETLILSGNPLFGDFCPCAGEEQEREAEMDEDCRCLLRGPNHSCFPEAMAGEKGVIRSRLKSLVLNFIPGVLPSLLAFLDSGRVCFPELRELYLAGTEIHSFTPSLPSHPSLPSSPSIPARQDEDLRSTAQIFRDRLPKLEILDLSRNQLQAWDREILPLLRAFPELRNLNLNRNAFPTLQPPRQRQQQEKEAFRLSIEAGEGKEDDEEKDRGAEVFPNLETLGIADNHLSRVTELDYLRSVFPKLKNVNLQRNPLDFGLYLDRDALHQEANELLLSQDGPGILSSAAVAGMETPESILWHQLLRRRKREERKLGQTVADGSTPSGEAATMTPGSAETASQNPSSATDEEIFTALREDSAVAGEERDWSRLIPAPRNSRELEDREFRDPMEEGIRLLCIALLPSGLEKLNRSWVSEFEKAQAALYLTARVWEIQETLTELVEERSTVVGRKYEGDPIPDGQGCSFFSLSLFSSLFLLLIFIVCLMIVSPLPLFHIYVFSDPHRWISPQQLQQQQQE